MTEEDKTYKPDWTPENAGDEFAVRVVKASERSGVPTNNNKRKDYSTAELVEGVVANDRVMLAKTITLIESNARAHFEKAQEVVQELLPKSGNSIRIGISGVPGAGKSTLIEALGMYLIEKGHKVAVLTIDPSSALTKGSILGDKTRMEKLSRESNCFIRPSPSGGTLGGVTRKSRETIIACEAAGYDVILVETVGVGQSEITVRSMVDFFLLVMIAGAGDELQGIKKGVVEITVRSMVDFFLLVMIAGAGDELQGIKKGVVEICDALFVNKADGENEQKANRSRSEYANALHYLKPVTEGWRTNAFTCSAITGKGIDELWKVVNKFEEVTKTSGVFEDRRKNQKIEWVFRMIEDDLKDRFYNHPQIQKNLPEIKDEILNGRILPTAAAEKLLKIFGS